MSNSHENQIPRRAFLRGAVGAVGLTLLGANSAFAGVVKKAFEAERNLQLMFWDDGRFVPAEKLAPGDTELQSVVVRMRSYGVGQDIKYIDAVSSARTKKGDNAVFHALSVPKVGTANAKFSMDVSATGGLRLLVHQGKGESAKATPIVITGNRSAAPRLREGTYVLSTDDLDLANANLDPANKAAPLTDESGNEVRAQYILITITAG